MKVEQEGSLKEVFKSNGLSSWWFFVRVVFHQVSHLSGWSLIKLISHHVGLSSGWPLIQVFLIIFFIKLAFLHPDSLLTGCSLIRVVFHHGLPFLIGLVSRQGTLSSGWSLVGGFFIRLPFFIRWPFTRMISHQGFLPLYLSFYLFYFFTLQVNGKYVLKSGTDFRNCSKLTLLQNGIGWTVEIERIDLTSDYPEDPELKAVVGTMLGRFIFSYLIDDCYGWVVKGTNLVERTLSDM